jgi:hypothetical protein
LTAVLCVLRTRRTTVYHLDLALWHDASEFSYLRAVSPRARPEGKPQMKTTKPIRSFAAVTLIAALAACGGGGGGSTGGGIPGTPQPTATPTGATPTPTATPSPTPTPTVAPQTLTGSVVDVDHANAPVAGATVSVGTAWTYSPGSGYILSGVTATATSKADGSFAISIAGAQYVQVTATGLVAAHRPILTTPNQWAFQPPAGTIGAFQLPTANADELGGLAEMNKNRATGGSGQGAQPLTLDADEMLSARAHAKDEATQGYYGHISPGTNYAYSGHYVCTPLGGFCANPLFTQENLDEGPGSSGSLALADDVYFANPPGEGHHDNVVSKTNLWVGFGAAYGGKPDPASVGNGTESYFAENFVTSTANPSP